jgi:hypothetical protein
MIVHSDGTETWSADTAWERFWQATGNWDRAYLLHRTNGQNMGSETWNWVLYEWKKFVGLNLTMFWGSVDKR